MVPNTRQSQFIEFIGEDASAYRVRSGSDVETLPKTFHPPQPQSFEHKETHNRAARLLRWAMVGLLPAGLGALVLAPLAALAASRELRLAVDEQDQRQALVTLGLAVLLLLAALPLAYLFLLHW